MLAKLSATMPDGDGWLYEPKWDGFRALVFRDGDEVYLQSRDRRPLSRYFPELVDPIRASLPARSVLDGEIVIVGEGGLDFSSLLLRIHPAASRIALLSREIPASLVVWDLLALDDRDLTGAPLEERRRRLEEAPAGTQPPHPPSPAPGDPAPAPEGVHRLAGARADRRAAHRP